MLTKIEARSPSGELLSLPLDDMSGGFIVADVKGLDPVKATIVTSPIATMDGAQLQTTRREPRNIFIELEVEPDWSAESVRDLRFRLYDFFMPEAQVNLRFIHSVAEDFEVEINGVVESFDFELFTDEPKAVISIINTSPDFVVLENTVVEGVTVSDTTETLVAYPGTVETGLIFTITLDRDLDEFELYVRGPDNVTRLFSFFGNFIADDILTVNSLPGSKQFYLTRGGTQITVLYGVYPSAPWPTLWKGNNYIRLVIDGDPGDPLPYEVSFRPKYGGL